MIDHQKNIAYHPQLNGFVESYNKTLTKGLTKLCSIEKYDWDDMVLAILWEYRIAYKRSTGKHHLN